eukprot:gene2126-19686_t
MSDYDDYDDDFEDEEDFQSTRGSKRSPAKKKGQRRPPRDVDSATSSVVWSANHERLNRVQNKLSEANRELKDAKQEIKTLKAMQRRQAKALDSTTGADAELPRKLRRQNEDIRILEERLRTTKNKLSDVTLDNKKKVKQVNKVSAKAKELQALVDAKDLKGRAALEDTVSTLRTELEARDAKIERLSKLVELQSKERHRKPKGGSNSSSSTAEVLSLRKQVSSLKSQLKQLRHSSKLLPQPPSPRSKKPATPRTTSRFTTRTPVGTAAAAGTASAAASPSPSPKPTSTQAHSPSPAKLGTEWKKVDAADLMAEQQEAEANAAAAEAEAEVRAAAADATAASKAAEEAEAAAHRAAEEAATHAAAEVARKKKDALLAKLKAIDQNKPAPKPVSPVKSPIVDDFEDDDVEEEDIAEDNISSGGGSDDGPALPWLQDRKKDAGAGAGAATPGSSNVSTPVRSARRQSDNLHKGFSSDGVMRTNSGRVLDDADGGSSAAGSGRRPAGRARAGAPEPSGLNAKGSDIGFLPNLGNSTDAAPSSGRRRQGKEPKVAGANTPHHLQRKGGGSNEKPMPWETQTLRTYNDGLASEVNSDNGSVASNVNSQGSVRRARGGAGPASSTGSGLGDGGGGAGDSSNDSANGGTASFLPSIATSSSNNKPGSGRKVRGPGRRGVGGPSSGLGGGPGGGSLAGFGGPRRRGRGAKPKTLPWSSNANSVEDDGMEAIAI